METVTSNGESAKARRRESAKAEGRKQKAESRRHNEKRHCERSEAIQKHYFNTENTKKPQSYTEKFSYSSRHCEECNDEAIQSRRRESTKARMHEGAKARRHEGAKAEGRRQNNSINQLFSYSVTQLFSYSLLRSSFKRSYGLKILHLKVLCLTILCLSVSFASAQTPISYTYDASGNRTHRTIVMKSPEMTPPPQDSTENVIDDEEEPFAYTEGVENEDETLQETNNNKKTQQEVYTDALSETLITIYPNPTRGLLTVKFTNMPQDAVSNITLFDMQGKIITQQQSLSDENRLDISAQPVGTYIMQIAVGDEKTSWKIVKQ